MSASAYRIRHSRIRDYRIRAAGAAVSVLTAVAAWSALCLSAIASDWPQWRCDAARSSFTPHPLQLPLHLQWSLHLPPQDTAWKDEEVMKFDRSYQPVVLGQLLFIGSTINDSLSAYDLGSGQLKWRFYTEGPIRTAPAAWQDAVVVASDDGCLYCLAAQDGSLRWRLRGAPTDRRLIGNQRLISTWPARGGPVIQDGVVYAAFGVWPFMGTFVHAVDIATGKPLWTNDSTSFTWRALPHAGAMGFSGLSPQGHLAIADKLLIVPGSRYQAAVFDRHDGRFLFYAEALGPEVSTAGQYAIAGGELVELKTGRKVQMQGIKSFGQVVLAEDLWATEAGLIDPKQLTVAAETVKVRESSAKDAPQVSRTVLRGRAPVQPGFKGTPWAKAGPHWIVVNGNAIQVFEQGDTSGAPLWQQTVEGTVSSILVAQGRLIVVTVQGDILCYAPVEHPVEQPAAEQDHAEQSPAGPQAHDMPHLMENRRAVPGGEGATVFAHGAAQPQASGGKRHCSAPPAEDWAARVDEILQLSGVREGYCLVFGLIDGGLVEQLVRRTRLHVIAVDADPQKVHCLRQRLDAEGLYGTRAAAIVADPLRLPLAPYLASLIVSEDVASAGFECGVDFARRLFWPLRPYGGVACLAISPQQHAQLGHWVNEADLAGAELKRQGSWSLLCRPGALPGAADWCGQNADAGNTRFSRDRLVMAPLGVLWFGNALSNSLVLPRHGEGPVQQVVAGRMFIEGPDELSAADVYTGRLLWTRRFPGLGKLYNSTRHQPGAHSIGSNFFAVADAVYVAYGQVCHELDPATGQTRKQLRLPMLPGDEEPSQWQFLLVYEDLLVAGAYPVVDQSQFLKGAVMYSPTSSRRLVAFNRRSGQVLWTRDAADSFRHYGVCAGAGKIFCIDRASTEAVLQAARRGEKVKETPRILALEARTGKLLWQTERHVGQQLVYAAEHDILLSQAALRGADGSVIWEDRAAAKAIWDGKWGPLVSSQWIFSQGAAAYDLLTGRQRTVLSAQGKQVPWRYQKAYGCAPKAAGEHLITFRSGDAGYYDLKHDGGTGNLGGFRSGCTPNLIIANGVLTAPDYTRTCTCAYQNRASLALVHMPEVEYWTFGAIAGPGAVALNFGAPGDRRAADGTLWRATPAHADLKMVSRVLARTTPKTARYFYHHVSRVQGGEALPWVAASGVIGIGTVQVPLEAVPADARLRIRLVFLDPECDAPGQRIFDVQIGGQKVIQRLDIVSVSGGPWRSLVREVRGLPVPPRPDDRPAMLELKFIPIVGQPLLCGAEITADQADRQHQSARADQADRLHQPD